MVVERRKKLLKECIEVFEKEIQKYENPDDIILENYIPSDGTYVIVKRDGTFKHYEIKFNKKMKELEEKPLNYEEIKLYDYYSRLVSMDKPQDPKKIIHSNSYLSFWIKKESFQNGKFDENAIDRYFSVLENPLEKYKKSQDINLYRAVERKIGPVDVKRAEKNRKWIHENIFKLEEHGVPMENKDYLKIFFEDSKESYTKEEQRYTYVKLFNNNDYNVEIGEEILGLPGNNLGYNSKKPYLEQLSKKIRVSNLMNTKNTLVQKKFFEYLMNQATSGNNNIYIDLEREEIFAKARGEFPDSDFAGIFLQIQKGKEAEIRYQDSIVAYKPTLNLTFRYDNVLKIVNKDNECGDYNDRKSIQGIINQVFFSKTLITNYFTDIKDLSITDGVLKQCLIESRDAIFTWLYKGQVAEIGKRLGKVGMKLAINSIERGYIQKAGQQFNLASSFDQYGKNGREENMVDTYSKISGSLREKMNIKDVKEDPKILSDKEYFFAVGQLVRYFISLSKAKDKPHSLAIPFFSASNNEKLKKKLWQMFMKYNHTIASGSKRFNRLYGMITRYELEGEFNGNEIIAGYLSENLIYEKEEKNNEQ